MSLRSPFIKSRMASINCGSTPFLSVNVCKTLVIKLSQLVGQFRTKSSSAELLWSSCLTGASTALIIVRRTTSDLALQNIVAKSRKTDALCGRMASASAKHRSIKSSGQTCENSESSSGGDSKTRKERYFVTYWDTIEFIVRDCFNIENTDTTWSRAAIRINKIWWSDKSSKIDIKRTRFIGRCIHSFPTVSNKLIKFLHFRISYIFYFTFEHGPHRHPCKSW